MTRCYPVSTQDLEDLLAEWIKAEKAVTTGQNYSVEGLSVSRVDAEYIAKRINELSREICARRAAEGGRSSGFMVATWD